MWCVAPMLKEDDKEYLPKKFETKGAPCSYDSEVDVVLRCNSEVSKTTSYWHWLEKRAPHIAYDEVEPVSSNTMEVVWWAWTWSIEFFDQGGYPSLKHLSIVCPWRPQWTH